MKILIMRIAQANKIFCIVYFFNYLHVTSVCFVCLEVNHLYATLCRAAFRLHHLRQDVHQRLQPEGSHHDAQWDEALDLQCVCR